MTQTKHTDNGDGPLTIISLKYYRKAFGLTASDVADRAGISLQTVYRIEQGKTDLVKSMSRYMWAIGLKMSVSMEVSPPKPDKAQPS